MLQTVLLQLDKIDSIIFFRWQKKLAYIYVHMGMWNYMHLKIIRYGCVKEQPIAHLGLKF